MTVSEFLELAPFFVGGAIVGALLTEYLRMKLTVRKIKKED